MDERSRACVAAVSRRRGPVSMWRRMWLFMARRMRFFAGMSKKNCNFAAKYIKVTAWPH